MENFQDTIKKWYEISEDFILDMTYDLAHDYLFLSTHFPIFFIIQSLFICLIVRKSEFSKKWWKSLLISWSMTMFGRIFTAIFTGRRPPLLENPIYTPLFLLIWFLINCSPLDLIYKLFNLKIMNFLLQLLNSIIQIRETCHGIDFGLRAFPSSIVGSILLSSILSSSDSFIFLIVKGKSKDFNDKTIYKNLLISIFYLFITQYPEYFQDYLDTTKEYIKINLLFLNLIITFINNLIFGINSNNSIDWTLFSYFGYIFSFKGNSVSTPRK